MAQDNITPAFTTVEAPEFAREIKSPDVFLIDVRTPDEFKDGHIEGAHNIDVQSPDFLTDAEKILPRDKTIAVNCGSGKRSALASEKLSAAGYKVLNLAGGLAEWKEAGLPVVK